MIHSDNLSAEPRLIAPTAALHQEEALERALRPKQLGEYVGRKRFAGSWRYSSKRRSGAKSRSITCCCSARRLGQDHPGANHRARDGRESAHTSGPVLERAGDLAGY